MTTALQGWIDDPDDPWVGFVLERGVDTAHPGGKLPLFDLAESYPTTVRVRGVPENFPTLRCNPGFRMHPDDHERLTGHRRTEAFVCPHMGRFVE